MRRSTFLPQFQPSPLPALEAAVAAEDQGWDGVFVYDHLWPLTRQAGAPVAECLTLLAALAAATHKVRVGTLVLRIGLRPLEPTVSALRTIAGIAPGRLVVGMGTGDHMSAEENLRFGIPFGSVDERLRELRGLAEALSAEGIEVWLGGRSRALRQVCADLGLTWNCWAVTDTELAAALAEIPQERVTWAGPADPPAFGVPVQEVVTAYRKQARPAE